MITLDDLVNAVKQEVELYDFLQEQSHDYDCFKDLVETHSYIADDVETLLRELCVDNSEERIEWFNCSELDGDEIVKLANVEFNVNECNYCETKGFDVQPENWDDFQGVNEGDCAVSHGEINSSPFTVSLCSSCLSKVESFLF